MSFTDGKSWIATQKDVETNWGGLKHGEKFRCGLCGHKFEVGNRVRWQYTNDTPGAGGNPLICATCDGPDVVERWAAHCAEWESIVENPKWWRFIR